MPDLRSGLDPKDYRYINPNPDPDFSPERNKAIVDQTIREATAYLTDFDRILDDTWKERRDILKSYAIHTLSKGGSQSLEKYIGRAQYEALVGEKLLSKIRVAESANKLRGNTLFKKGILL